MTPEQAMERINVVLAHAWMVRAFLKHADEVQEDADMMEVHRLIFDTTRAVEPSYERRDVKEYLRRVKGKLPKLRKTAEFFAQEYKRISDHTNFQMAALSLQGVVAQLEEIFAGLRTDSQSSTDTDRAEAVGGEAANEGKTMNDERCTEN